MDTLDVFLIRLRLLLLITPEALNLGLILFLSDSKVADFRIQILDLCSLALYGVAFFLKLGLE